ncbi:MAG: hypothetical protein JXR37_15080 [Kiritimatiellae bacterium]|nr:hypothetical protein [Kiritimatiellia bacterium]
MTDGGRLDSRNERLLDAVKEGARSNFELFAPGWHPEKEQSGRAQTVQS